VSPTETRIYADRQTQAAYEVWCAGAEVHDNVTALIDIAMHFHIEPHARAYLERAMEMLGRPGMRDAA
jgi:hypothetical protein